MGASQDVAEALALSDRDFCRAHYEAHITAYLVAKVDAEMTQDKSMDVLIREVSTHQEAAFGAMMKPYQCVWCGDTQPDHACPHYAPPVDYVTYDDYEEAARLLIQCMDGALPIGKQWLDQVFKHLVEKLDGYFRAPGIPRDSKAFTAMIKTMAQGYREGAQALDWAARRLKEKHHDTHGANETMKAAQTMARAAQELIGEPNDHD